MRACKICECGEILYYSPPEEECPDPCPICGRMTLGYEAFAENDPRIELERNKILEKRSVTRVSIEEEEPEDEKSDEKYDDPYGTNETVVLQPSQDIQTPPGFNNQVNTGMPSGFGTPSGVQMPPGFSAPSGINSQTNPEVPSGFGTPSGVQMPPSFSTPSGVQTPPGFNNQTNPGTPSGVQMPPSFSAPSGVQTPPGFNNQTNPGTPSGFGSSSGVQTPPGFGTPPVFKKAGGATISESVNPNKTEVPSNNSVPSWKQAVAGGIKEPAKGSETSTVSTPGASVQASGTREKKLKYRLRSIQRGYVIELPNEECVVGRTAVGGEQLAHNNAVSREHIRVQINKRQRGIIVTDISQFGTKINGNPAIKNKKEMLFVGQRITLYNEELILEVFEET